MARTPVENTSAFMSTARRGGRWRTTDLIRGSAFCGVCTIDLRQAEIVGDPLVVKASAFLGVVRVVVPPGCAVNFNGATFLGTMKDDRSEPGETGAPTVDVQASAFLGKVQLTDHDVVAEEPAPLTSIDEVAESVAEERPPLQHGTAPDGTTTVLFSDIEGFTAINDRLGDRQAFEVLKNHNQVVRDQVDAYGGFEVKSQGDGFMVAFSSARQAVLCAIAIQKALAAEGGEPVRVRIGLHTGEAIKDADDFFGRNVIFAARIADEAQGGEILVSSLVKELTESGGEFQFENGR